MALSLLAHLKRPAPLAAGPMRGELLNVELHPAKAVKNPAPYSQVWCCNPRCPSDTAREIGGSAATEEQAYRSLWLAVEDEHDELQPDEQRERDEDAKAEAKGDMERSGGP